MILAIIKSLQWLVFFLRHSGTLSRNHTAPISRAVIMKHAHIIEKGMSLRAARPFFGKEKRERLLSEMRRSFSVPENIAPVARPLGRAQGPPGR